MNHRLPRQLTDVQSGTEVLLINGPRDLTPIEAHSSRDRKMPLGLMYVSGFLKANGIACALFDAEASSLGVTGIIQAAHRLKPRIVGINCHSLNRWVVYEIARTLRVLLPRALIVLGGRHRALAPELTLRECDQIDGIVAGEGELVMLELAAAAGQPRDIPGFFYRDGSAIRSSGPAPRFQNLDELPFPDLTDIPIQQYAEFSEPDLPGFWRRAYVSASRGCLHRCSFCTENPAWNGVVSFRSGRSVWEEMEWYRTRHGLTRFYFYDDTLTDWPDLEAFCESAATSGFSWSCSTRIDHIVESSVERMARGGCREVAFGLESGSVKSLRLMRKGWQNVRTLDEVAEAVNLCSRYKVTPRAHFMVGFPWEEREDITASVEFAVSLKKHGLLDANFFVVKRYPGTCLDRSLAGSTGASSGAATDESHRYNVWSVYDWHTTGNPKVAAKLRRFNDVPEISLHPRLDSLTLRRLVRNAWEIFFGDCPVSEVDNLLWRGVSLP